MYYDKPTEGFFVIDGDAFEESLKHIDYTVASKGSWNVYCERHSGKAFAMQHDRTKETMGKEPFFKP